MAGMPPSISPQSDTTPFLSRIEGQAPILNHSSGNSFIGALRTRTSLPDFIRKLAIYRLAPVNRAQHEWNWHFPLLATALPSLPVATVDYIR
jgi:hypothetical protein